MERNQQTPFLRCLNFKTIQIVNSKILVLKVRHGHKGEPGTAELGANKVLKQTNELCF